MNLANGNVSDEEHYMQGNYKTHTYVSTDDPRRNGPTKMDVNGNDITGNMTLSSDGTAVRQEVISGYQGQIIVSKNHALTSNASHMMANNMSHMMTSNQSHMMSNGQNHVMSSNRSHVMTSNQSHVTASNGMLPPVSERTDADEVMDTLLSQPVAETNLKRSGSANSLRELYAERKTPPSSLRRRPKHMSMAPESEDLTNVLNQPAPITNGDQITSEPTHKNWKTSRINGNVNPVPESEDLVNIRDSIRALDLYLKTQQTDTDSQSQSSVGSKAMDKYGLSLTDEVTEL